MLQLQVTVRTHIIQTEAHVTVRTHIIQTEAYVKVRTHIIQTETHVAVRDPYFNQGYLNILRFYTILVPLSPRRGKPYNAVPSHAAILPGNQQSLLSAGEKPDSDRDCCMVIRYCCMAYSYHSQRHICITVLNLFYFRTDMMVGDLTFIQDPL